MSAYMVEDNTINSIVSFLFNSRNNGWYLHVLKQHGITDPKRLGLRMFALNKWGVESRYGKGQAKEFRALDYTYMHTMPPTKIQAYKSISNWKYQCMEGKVPETRFYKLMSDIHDAVAHQIVQDLEAYQNAKWG